MAKFIKTKSKTSGLPGLVDPAHKEEMEGQEPMDKSTMDHGSPVNVSVMKKLVETVTKKPYKIKVAK